MKVLYRAWDKDDEVMKAVIGLDWNDQGFLVSVIVEGGVKKLPNHVVLMRFTGLEDVEGNQIFAGDIVNDGVQDVVIEWSNTSASFWTSKATLKGWRDCKKVGNIYEKLPTVSGGK